MLDARKSVLCLNQIIETKIEKYLLLYLLAFSF